MLPDGRMDTKNAAIYRGCSTKTLAMERSLGTGPKFIKKGRIFYYKEDLDNWLLEGGKIQSTSQANQTV
ncbi:MAG: DNA-binding protein [Magnetococcales bacterium]|nr:DNA-binding protein [Magnetococcales bacterium]